jgi:hypothetical protein
MVQALLSLSTEVAAEEEINVVSGGNSFIL